MALKDGTVAKLIPGCSSYVTHLPTLTCSLCQEGKILVGNACDV
jgi:hypothetical protein